MLEKDKLIEENTDKDYESMVWENCQGTAYSSLVLRLNRPDRKKRLEYL